MEHMPGYPMTKYPGDGSIQKHKPHKHKGKKMRHMGSHKKKSNPYPSSY